MVSSRQSNNGLKFTLAERVSILVLGDVFFLFISILISLWGWATIWENSFFLPFLWERSYLFLLTIPWLLISIITNSYSLRNILHFENTIKQPLLIALLVCGIYIVLYFFAPTGSMPRIVIVFFGFVSCALMWIWRIFHFVIFSHQRWRQGILVVGEERMRRLIHKLLFSHKLYYEVCDAISITAFENLQSVPKGIDKIVFVSYEEVSAKCLQVLLKCREQGIVITSMPDFFEELSGRLPIRWIKGWDMSILMLREAEWSGFYPIAKRTIDVIMAVLGLAFFALIFPFIAIFIKVVSPGNLFFSQIRVGKYGRPFRLWKLRTMVDNTEEKGAIWTERGDQRIIWGGSILRGLHIDELPQLWNVLKGDLSIVGVRPLSLEQCEKFEREIEYHNLRHLVKPGITGWAIVNYRHVNDIEGARVRLEYDLYYVKYQALWLDFYIMLRTIWVILTLNSW